MPPHADGGVVPYDLVYTDRLGNMPVRQYVTTPIRDAMINPVTLEPYPAYPAYDGNGVTIDANRINANFAYDTLNNINLTDALREELDKIMKKIYHCIEEHTNIDITEEEFMNIIKGDD